MRLPKPVIRFLLRRRQKKLWREVAASPILFSEGSGTSPDDPIVITEAQYDHIGSAAIFAWMFAHLGTMDVDWHILTKTGTSSPTRHIDIYNIEMRSGERRSLYFDITESWGKWPPPEE